MTTEESIKTIKSMLVSPFHAHDFSYTERQALESIVRIIEEGDSKDGGKG